MIRSWTVPPVRRAMHWTSSGRISGSQWLTLTTSEQPIHIESVGLLITAGL